MSEINKEQLANQVASVDVWMDFTPPANAEGVFKYRKLTDDNMLEIYLNGRYTGSATGSILLGILAAKYRPSTTQIITGLITYKVLADNSSRLQMQYLNMGPDGEVKIIGGVGQELIRSFIFHGFVDL